MKLIALRSLALGFSLVVFASCSSKPHFNHGDLAEQAGVEKPIFDDNQEIQDEFKKKSNLPNPFKIAVYFKTPANKRDWQWTEEDKSMVDLVTQDLRKQGVVSEIFPIFSSFVSSESLSALRLAAAKFQADAVLVIDGSGSIERSVNSKAWSYALIVPTFFVKGSEVESLFKTNAALWDVRNGFLYLAAETEGVVRNDYVAAFGESDAKLYSAAKKASLEKMRDALKLAIAGSKT